MPTIAASRLMPLAACSPDRAMAFEPAVRRAVTACPDGPARLDGTSAAATPGFSARAKLAIIAGLVIACWAPLIAIAAWPY